MPDLSPAARPAPLSLARLLQPGERARVVPGASRYWATNHGRILSAVEDPAIEVRQTQRKNGYLQTGVWFDGENDRTRRRVVSTHVLVAAAFHGPRPDVPGQQIDVDHIDGCRTNNRLENLRYLPRFENVGRVMRSGEHPSAKLTPTDVWTLRCRALVAGTTVAVAEVMRRFTMTREAVRSALSGRSWSRVPQPAKRPTADDLRSQLSLDSAGEAERLLALSPFAQDTAEVPAHYPSPRRAA